MNLPQLISKYKTPKVLWYQDDDNVILRVLLTDVKEYFLKITIDHLKFSTLLNGDTYVLCFQLFGAVHPEQTNHIKFGREIKIYLSKVHKYFDWLRLTYHNEKCNLIMIDPDHIYKKRTQQYSIANKESFAEFKLKNKIHNIMPDVPSSDEDESDDEKLPYLTCD